MANVKFGIFSDLHVDLMHDCEKRLRVFLDACRQADVDFIIQLGDFCYPDEERICLCQPKKRPVNIQNAMDYPTYQDKTTIRNLYHNFEKPHYHVIGNHDLDMCSSEQMMAYFGGMTSTYYSFDCGGIHFVVLDANYCYVNGEYIHYDNGRYFDWSYDKPKPLPYLPTEELEWLRRDLAAAEYPAVIFSHQKLREGDLKNAEDFRAVIRTAPHGVLMCANGHQHKDNITKLENTWYWNVNSMSNYWLDMPYKYMGRYTPEIDARFPNIRYVVPYRDAVFGIVTIKDGVIDIQGRQSEFVGPSPAEQGFLMRSWEDIVSPSVTSYNVHW